MIKNSTLKLWKLLLNKKYLEFDRPAYRNLSEKQLEPQQKTINDILSYAKSVRGIDMKSGNRILISLN